MTWYILARNSKEGWNLADPVFKDGIGELPYSHDQASWEARTSFVPMMFICALATSLSFALARPIAATIRAIMLAW